MVINFGGENIWQNEEALKKKFRLALFYCTSWNPVGILEDLLYDVQL